MEIVSLGLSRQVLDLIPPFEAGRILKHKSVTVKNLSFTPEGRAI
jgi:hypothetical protein